MSAGKAAPAARLGRKQTLDQQTWLAARASIEQRVSREQLDALLTRTVAEAAPVIARYRRPAYCWSGGKDSLVLEGVMGLLGVDECVLGMCNLEVPAFLAWVTDHMPWRLEIVNTGQDLVWLADHPEMLFPQDAATAAHWFKIVQHTAQARYYRERGCDCLILGRRRMDGNYTGAKGANLYTNSAGVTRYSPLRDWTHEDIFAYLHYYGVALPPTYGWPNGYRVGTGAWAARQYTGSVEQGWREVYTIDPAIVREAALVIGSARDFLRAVEEQEG